MKSKTRRKMTFRRFAYYLLITAMVVSCVANGIFAKFTTKDDGGDGARVAKFGIVMSISGDWFSTSYYENDGSADSNKQAPYTTVETDDGISVQADFKYVLSNGNGSNAPSGDYSFNNVVAPGTKSSSGMVFLIEGTAETDIQLEYDFRVDDIFLMLGENISYGVMVPLNDGIIQEHNFEEFKNTLYTPEAPVDGVTTFTKVSGDFDADADYYQIEDETLHMYDGNGNVIGDMSYTPLTYIVKGNYKTPAGPDFNHKAGYANVDATDKRPRNLASYYAAEYINNAFIIAPLTAVPEEYKVYGKKDLAVAAMLEDYSTLEPEDSTNSTYGHSTGKSFPYETGSDVYIELTLNWEWAYNQPDISNIISTNVAHTYDTILGHLAAGTENIVKSTDNGATYATNLVKGSDYSLEASISLDVTANQID